MASFKDRDGSEWSVRVDVPMCARVREGCGFELGKLILDDRRRMNELAGDPVLLVRVLYWLCREQIEERKIEPEEFGRLFYGDSLADAFDAVVAAFLDFCPSQQSKVLRALLAKTAELEREIVEEQLREVQNLDAAKLLRITSGTPGNSVESSVSVPAVPA